MQDTIFFVKKIFRLPKNQAKILRSFNKLNSGELIFE